MAKNRLLDRACVVKYMRNYLPCTNRLVHRGVSSLLSFYCLSLPTFSQNLHYKAVKAERLWLVAQFSRLSAWQGIFVESTVRMVRIFLYTKHMTSEIKRKGRSWRPDGLAPSC